MKKSSFDEIVRALNEADVPFLVVGGIAVIHHGYGRLTQDVDIVIRLEPSIIHRAFEALGRIDYRPKLPVTADQFADTNLRETRKHDKGMRVLTFWSDRHRETPLDVFVEEPFDFSREYASADTQELLPGLKVRIVNLSTLLAMKRIAGRSQDMADIDELNLLHGKPSSYDEEA